MLFFQNRKVTPAKVITIGLFLFLIVANGAWAQSNAPASGGMALGVIRAINYLFLAASIVSALFLSYGAWLWYQAKQEDDEEKEDQAKRVTRNAGIAFAIAFLGYIMTLLMLGRAGYGPSFLNPDSQKPGYEQMSAAARVAVAGNSAIDSHYPAAGQQDVPRNAKVTITFKEPVDKDSLMKDGKLLDEIVKIYKNSDSTGSERLKDVTVNISEDGKTVTFAPARPLGSDSEKTWYTVSLSPDLALKSGGSAFTSKDGKTEYHWTFEVGTVLDLLPPYVVSILPAPGAVESRNAVIQINFSEAIDPQSIYGSSSASKLNVAVTDGAGKDIRGGFSLSNMYKTLEFIASDNCGVNSCGNAVYCLPASSTVNVLLKAATVSSGTTAPILDGLTDLAGNSLDGNKNGRSEGSATQSGKPAFDPANPNVVNVGDDYRWNFYVNRSTNLSAPVIIRTKPGIGEEGVGPSTKIEAVFDKLMLGSSLSKGNVRLQASPESAEIFYWVTKESSLSDKRTTVFIEHDPFSSAASYTPFFGSGILDVYQNCYTPSEGPRCKPDPDKGKPYCCNGVPSDKICNQ